VHRVLAAEASTRSLAGQPREEICAVLAGAATRAFDLLEPSLGGYGIRAYPGGHGCRLAAARVPPASLDGALGPKAPG